MFSELPLQSKIEIASQMVILDAIEKGHTDKSELIDYMQSDVFFESVKRYIKEMNQTSQ